VRASSGVMVIAAQVRRGCGLVRAVFFGSRFGLGSLERFHLEGHQVDLTLLAIGGGHLVGQPAGDARQFALVQLG
jgi:hypothetical protein